jgi:uncharacterized protein YpiB (UPF0302 family)
MTRANIYSKENFWCVDYIDSNYEMLPAVGMFTELEAARQSALEWCEGVLENVAIVGKGSW